MNIHDAAERLQERLEQYSWLASIGVGRINQQDAIYVYTRYAINSREIGELLKSGWMGYPVVVEKVGSLRPLAGQS